MGDHDIFIGRLEGKVDLILTNIQTNNIKIIQLEEKINTVDKKVEADRNKKFGVFAVLGVLAGLFGAFVKPVVDKFL